MHYYFLAEFPNAPTAATASAITATSALISWNISNIPSTVESYYVTYGSEPTALVLVSPSQTNGTNFYTQLLAGLNPSETYYFRVVANNEVGTIGSDIDSFMTLNGCKYHFGVALLTHEPYMFYFLSTKWTSTELYGGS